MLFDITWNQGGAYVICKLDGAVLDQPIAALCVVPYFARKKLNIPQDALNVHSKCLEEMHQSGSLGNDDAIPKPPSDGEGDNSDNNKSTDSDRSSEGGSAFDEE
jgi:hypothetical protein